MMRCLALTDDKAGSICYGEEFQLYHIQTIKELSWKGSITHQWLGCTRWWISTDPGICTTSVDNELVCIEGLPELACEYSTQRGPY